VHYLPQLFNKCIDKNAGSKEALVFSAENTRGFLNLAQKSFMSLAWGCPLTLYSLYRNQPGYV
jgi:hypothetical protein